MWPANVVARPVLLNFLFPSNLCDAISKAEPLNLIEPRAYDKRIIQTHNTSLYLFQDSAVHPLLSNNSITRGPSQLQYIAELHKHTSNYLSEGLARLSIVGIM